MEVSGDILAVMSDRGGMCYHSSWTEARDAANSPGAHGARPHHNHPVRMSTALQPRSLALRPS